MKFLALGLLMFLQAGQMHEGNGNSITYDPKTSKIYMGKEEWVPGSGGAPPEQDKEIHWVGSSESKQVVTVPWDWKCTVFNNDDKDPSIVGVVCTKPKQK